MKKLYTYFSIFIILLTPFKLMSAENPIIVEGIPFVFDATLQSVDSTNTAVFLWKKDNKKMNRLLDKGLDNSNFGNFDDDHFLLRVGIAGAPYEAISEEKIENIKKNLHIKEYELTCFNIDRIGQKSRMPVCYIESQDGVPLLVELHNATKSYFPLNYEFTGDSKAMIEVLRNVEKELIISDFMM